MSVHILKNKLAKQVKELTETLEEKEAVIRNLRGQITSIRQSRAANMEIRHLQDEVKDKSKQLVDYALKNGDIDRRNHQLERENKWLRGQLDGTKVRNTELTNQLRDEKRKVEELKMEIQNRNTLRRPGGP